MTWLRIDTGLPGHRKTARLAKALRVRRGEAVGLLVSLWAYSDTYHPDGDISSIDWEHAAECADFTRHDDLKRALREAGFIDVSDAGVWTWHDWMDHQGHAISRRAANAERMRRARNERDTSAARAAHVRGTFVPTDGRTDGRTESEPATAPDGAVDPRVTEWKANLPPRRRP